LVLKRLRMLGRVPGENFDADFVGDCFRHRSQIRSWVRHDEAHDSKPEGGPPGPRLAPWPACVSSQEQEAGQAASRGPGVHPPRLMARLSVSRLVKLPLLLAVSLAHAAPIVLKTS